MPRTFALALLVVIIQPLRAETPVRPVAVRGDLDLLTKAQQAWLAQFESDALAARDPESASKWLDTASAGARDAGLEATADYLATCARVLRGDASVADAECQLRRTLEGVLFVAIRFDGRTISDIVVCTLDQTRSRTLESAMHQFERSLPGFEESWFDFTLTRGISRIAKLHFRAGKNAATASNGTYAPFDRALIPVVGRTWVVHENIIRASWWGEGVRPVVQRLFPEEEWRASADALIDWYATRPPIYDIGPPLTSADRDRLGSSRDPILILKADLLSSLLRGDVTTLVVMALYVLRDVSAGNAPPAHRPAAATEINWLVERGALRFDEATTTWRINIDACRTTVRDLANDVMAIERAGDADRAAALLARYGATNAPIDKSVAVIDALPEVRVQPLYTR